MKINRIAVGLLLFLLFSCQTTMKTTQANSNTKIRHKPIKYFVPDYRIIINAEVSDPNGVNLVRCYFKASSQANYVFVSMQPNSNGYYEGILPAPDKETQNIEYLFLVSNNKKKVVKTQKFTVTKKDSKDVPSWQNVGSQGKIQVNTESKVVTQQNWQNYSYTPPSSQPSAQSKPAEPKTQPTTQLTQTAQQQIQQPQPIQQQQQTTVYAKPQLADRRIALVIGNEKYINAPLDNPVNDSRAIGRTLKKLGFKTLQYENLSQKEMKRGIDDFGTQLKNYDVGLFFYSGHGTQIKGENYLIPIDAAPKSENEVDYDCLPTGRVLAKMEDSGSVTNIIILDACRNNPFERSWSRSSQSKGLVFMNAPSGSLIAYATSPGKIAFDQSSQKNSPYTAALLKHIETPNISIVEMFQRVRVTVEHETGKEQTPWESTSLRDNFYFYRQNVQ